MNTPKIHFCVEKFSQKNNWRLTGRLLYDQDSKKDTESVNFQIFKLVLEKAGEPGIKLPTSAESSKKQESSRKISTSALLTMPNPLTVWTTTNCRKFFKRWAYQTT